MGANDERLIRIKQVLEHLQKESRELHRLAIEVADYSKAMTSKRSTPRGNKPKRA